MQRTIVPAEKYYSQELSPGVRLERFYPGGKNGPNGECLFNTPGGQTWSDTLFVGDPSDAFQLLLPDIRLPANQFWPLHWHDCWTVVLVLEGECLIGDWWMQAGDVFITEPSLEYGPLVIGPQGCRMFEIFAKAHLSRGGYAPVYRDHPTLQHTQSVFTERSPINQRNEGRQTMPCDGVPGITKTKLSPDKEWDLGESTDPERGVMKDTRLVPGQRMKPHRYEDWHVMVVLSGSVQIAGRTLGRDDYLVIRPNSRVAAIEAGSEGAQLLELSRTARGAVARPVA